MWTHQSHDGIGVLTGYDLFRTMLKQPFMRAFLKWGDQYPVSSRSVCIEGLPRNEVTDNWHIKRRVRIKRYLASALLLTYKALELQVLVWGLSRALLRVVLSESILQVLCTAMHELPQGLPLWQFFCAYTGRARRADAASKRINCRSFIASIW